MHDPEDDVLPAFSTLTNDEDREKKAGYRAPGTYNIVVNLSSFTYLDEYREDSEEARSRVESVLGVPHWGQQRSHTIAGRRSYEPLTNDPNVVILSRFEEDTGIATSTSTRSSQHRDSVTPGPSIPSCTNVGRYSEISNTIGDATSGQCFFQIPYRDSTDHELISHFNSFVQRSMAQVHRDSLGTPSDTDALLSYEVFAQQAAQFAPVRVVLHTLSDHFGSIKSKSTVFT